MTYLKFTSLITDSTLPHIFHPPSHSFPIFHRCNCCNVQGIDAIAPAQGHACSVTKKKVEELTDVRYDLYNTFQSRLHGRIYKQSQGGKFFPSSFPSITILKYLFFSNFLLLYSSIAFAFNAFLLRLSYSSSPLLSFPVPPSPSLLLTFRTSTRTTLAARSLAKNERERRERNREKEEREREGMRKTGRSGRFRKEGSGKVT